MAQKTLTTLRVIIPPGPPGPADVVVTNPDGQSATLVGGFTYVAPNILLQAVFEPDGKTDEGTLIRAVSPAWFEIIKMLTDEPNSMYEIDPRKWEEIIAASYHAAGFDEVILTPRSGDLGRDVIAVKRGLYQVRFIDQVKAYKPDHLVTANDVRALIGVLQSDRRATKGIVTTTSSFAPKITSDDLISPYIPYRLELVDGEALLDRLARIGDQEED